MKVDPVARLLIPAALFALLMAAPGRRVLPSGDAGPAPLVATASEPPPDVPLEELFHELAEPGATLTVVEFSDFGCPYCGQFERSTFPALRDEFVKTGKVRWRFVPFVLGMFPNGFEAMRASTWVAERRSCHRRQRAGPALVRAVHTHVLRERHHGAGRPTAAGIPEGPTSGYPLNFPGEVHTAFGRPW